MSRGWKGGATGGGCRAFFNHTGGWIAGEQVGWRGGLSGWVGPSSFIKEAWIAGEQGGWRRGLSGWVGPSSFIKEAWIAGEQREAGGRARLRGEQGVEGGAGGGSRGPGWGRAGLQSHVGLLVRAEV